ncbi:2-hydroxychromene-2-carboxylate isomerase [Flavisphingomonas formosensis]|uniref:2-hydroxychromene-2-carboxylate isomerase n=1 Tax=Flavisphingomonas formosensis TaxID=861534 RepID=UPI0012F9C820|nr:2-hydroxychromene-2-carboxylate isomerase [Sphingomonas formosensis]
MDDRAPTCDWFFDIVSPFAYLQWKTRARLAGRIRLRPVPILFGAILGHWQQKGPAEIAPKRLHTYRYCQWRADTLGVPFRFPPGHPFNPVSALRLVVALGAGDAAVDALFDAAFGEGRDVSDMTELAAIGHRFGIADVEVEIARPDIKQRLRANTDAALARGVFGVPTIDVAGTLFWGEDATDMLIAYLDDPDLFDTPEMRRIAALPVAATRPTKPA